MVSSSQCTRVPQAGFNADLVTARFAHLPTEAPIVAALLGLALSRCDSLVATKPPREAIPNTHLLPRIPSPEQILDEDPILTSLPEVFMRIREVLSNPASTVEEAASVIGKDPSLTAKLLKLVNSPFYRRTLCACGGVPPGPVDTLSRAVMLLGLNQLSTLAMGVSVLPLFRHMPAGRTSMELFWRHSVGVGLVAKQISTRLGDPNPERFFVAGLLHDIGRLVLYKQLPAAAGVLAAQSVATGTSLLEQERKALGFDHADLGGMLLRKWHFPESLEQAVWLHHDPLLADEPLEAAIINVADMIADALLPGSSGERIVPAFLPEAWAATRLTTDQIPELADTAAAHLEIITSMFL